MNAQVRPIFPTRLPRSAVAVITAFVLLVVISGLLSHGLSHCARAQASLPPGIVGVTAVTIRDDFTRAEQYDHMKAEGFSAVRLIIEWPLIEPEPGQFD